MKREIPAILFSSSSWSKSVLIFFKIEECITKILDDWFFEHEEPKVVYNPNNKKLKNALEKRNKYQRSTYQRER
jgi:hypothetical protein